MIYGVSTFAVAATGGPVPDVWIRIGVDEPARACAWEPFDTREQVRARIRESGIPVPAPIMSEIIGMIGKGNPTASPALRAFVATVTA